MLSLLFEGRFDDYAEAVRKDAELWLFVHVPKTAGSSMAKELAAMQPPYFNIHIDHLDRSKPGAERFDLAVEDFLARARGTRFRSASGHIHNRHMQAIQAALPGVKPFTMLRHPLARIVSDYRYQRSSMHPLQAQVIERTPDFESFSKLPGQRNRMAKHLAPIQLVRKGEVQACIDYVMERYAFVGLQENYGLHFQALTTLISGAPRGATQRQRVNEEVETIELSPEMAAAVEADHAVDFGIYNAFAERLAPLDNALAAWVADKAPVEASEA